MSGQKVWYVNVLECNLNDNTECDSYVDVFSTEEAAQKYADLAETMNTEDRVVVATIGGGIIDSASSIKMLMKFNNGEYTSTEDIE